MFQQNMVKNFGKFFMVNNVNNTYNSLYYH